MVACLTMQDDFWTSLYLMGAHYAVSECWTPPALTMLQNTTSVANQGVAVSLYSSINWLVGLGGTLILGYL